MKHKSHSVLHSHNELGAKVLESSADSKKNLRQNLSKFLKLVCLIKYLLIRSCRVTA